MPALARNILPKVEEHEATGDTVRIYDEIKRELQLPFVPNLFKTLAISPGALAMYWSMLRSLYQHSTLPQSLIAMILYTVAQANDCQYCSAGYEVTCRTLGIDEETLGALTQDLGQVAPERIQAIIRFALKVTHNPKGLLAEDYDRLRNQGVTDAEAVEIVLIAAAGGHGNLLADALKVDVDAQTAQALGH
ncbi:MAG TPA: carboxymuconolactone decarboxylase family protein [Caldilineaceae bacterium]|nr:carboxymuconolactone decarboxylase family protein [Caldilineaceae bacterium]